MLGVSLTISSFNCEISPQKGELSFNGKVIVLRPKTFELLLLLASKPGTIISKTDILAKVWQDSVVEDQVVFQSINEIRKELGHNEIIKTYPRRGYSWEVANTSLITTESSKPITSNTPTTSAEAKPKTAKRSRTTYAVLGLVMLILSSSSLFFYYSQESRIEIRQNNIAQQELHSGILVLPFNVEALSESKKWLRFGAMEGLIKKIAPQKNITVFHLEDVIEILNRLPLEQRGNIDSIFAKSGASHILETSLSGVPGDFNIVYTIYSRNFRSTKTLQAMNIDSALTQLVNVFETKLNEKLSLAQHSFTQQLQNELTAKAIQFLAVNDNNSALAFIESALVTDQNNITALYYLSTILMNLNEEGKALEALNKALTFELHQEYSQYQPRLLYLKGVALLNMGDIQNAELNLKAAEQKAKTNKDWLYYSYTQSILGKLRQHQGNYDLAFQRFNAAMNYQELLHCPMGIAQTHLDLTELYLENGDMIQAQKQFDLAKKLVVDKKLTQVTPLLHFIEKQLNEKTSTKNDNI